MSLDPAGQLTTGFDLPQGWDLKSLKQVTRPSTQKVDPSECPEVPYLSLEHIEARTTRILGRGTAKEVSSTKAVFHAGDVLYGRLRPYLNKVARPNFDGVASTDILVFPPQEGLDQRYLLRFLNSQQVVDLAHHHSKGLQMPRISFEILGDIQIPLPPIKEQTRIADLMDIVTDGVGLTKNRLAKIQRLLKKYRQSVLEAACCGQLTAGWRGTDDLSGWTHDQAQNVCNRVQSGSTPREGFQDFSGVPFLKVYNLVDQKIDFDYKPQFVSQSVAQSKSMIRSTALPGDVLMNIVGPPLGKVAIVTDQYKEWTFNQALTLFRPSDRISTQWLYVVLCSGLPYEDILTQTRGSAGQSNISLTQCREMMLPIPPVAEQAEIVRRVDSHFVLADAAELHIVEAINQVEHTNQAILAKAFRGELNVNHVYLPGRETDTSAAELPHPTMPSPKEEEKNTKMKSSLKEIVQMSEQTCFDPDELRKLFSGDYDSFRKQLFAILKESSPVMKQEFDSASQRIQLVKV